MNAKIDFIRAITFCQTNRVYLKIPHHFDLTPNPSPKERGALEPNISSGFYILNYFLVRQF